MKATLAVLLGVASARPLFSSVKQNPEGRLDMKRAWQQEFTYDWKDLDHTASFEHWKLTFNKTYSGNDEAAAYLTFLENWEYINEFNRRGEESYTLGMNQFSDLNADQFKMAVHGHTGSCLKHRTVGDRVAMSTDQPSLRVKSVPDSIDWTSVNGVSYVTAVKNQGQCGSCWAFSTTGSLESRYAIKNKVTGSSIVPLSEQQLIDCSSSYGNMGCNGGLMDYAFKYIQNSGGLCSETDYAYTAETGTECKATSCTAHDAITGYTDVTAESEDDLMAAVAEGPVSIAIEADQSAFQFYKSGVLTGRCGDRLDHGVLVVGYGELDGQKYWKVKNSWGETWGQDGYILICRDCDANRGAGECGILMTPSYPEPASA